MPCLCTPAATASPSCAPCREWIAWCLCRDTAPNLEHGCQLIDAPAAIWDYSSGRIPNAGLGMKIGDIDTGIEPSHPAFQTLPALSGLSPPGAIPSADCGFTSRKIIVARSYVRGESAGSPPNPAVDSRPDDYTILDHYGHGTGTASVAAGETTIAPAATITGITALPQASRSRDL